MQIYWKNESENPASENSIIVYFKNFEMKIN